MSPESQRKNTPCVGVCGLGYVRGETGKREVQVLERLMFCGYQSGRPGWRTRCTALVDLQQGPCVCIAEDECVRSADVPPLSEVLVPHECRDGTQLYPEVAHLGAPQPLSTGANPRLVTTPRGSRLRSPTLERVSNPCKKATACAGIEDRGAENNVTPLLPYTTASGSVAVRGGLVVASEAWT